MVFPAAMVPLEQAFGRNAREKRPAAHPAIHPPGRTAWPGPRSCTPFPDRTDIRLRPAHTGDFCGLPPARLVAGAVARLAAAPAISCQRHLAAGPNRGPDADDAGSASLSALPPAASRVGAATILLGIGAILGGSESRLFETSAPKIQMYFQTQTLPDPGRDVHVPVIVYLYDLQARKNARSRSRSARRTSSCCRTCASRCFPVDRLPDVPAHLLRPRADRDLPEGHRLDRPRRRSTCCCTGSSTTTVAARRRAEVATPADLVQYAGRQLPAVPARLGPVPPDRRHALPVRLPTCPRRTTAISWRRASPTSGAGSTSTGRTS